MKTNIACLMIVTLIAMPGSRAANTEATCEDTPVAKAVVKPDLDTAFFHKSRYERPWWIVESEGGSVEDTTDGSLGADDLVHLEVTADCVSTHQGEHPMSLCAAVATKQGMSLAFTGGMPAYCSDLNLEVKSDGSFKCAFDAVYPNPKGPLKWRITQKELRLKTLDFKAGRRVLGWLSVSFEEIDTQAQKTMKHKIEGFFKPVLQHRPQDAEGEKK